MHSHLLFGALALAVPAFCLPRASASSASADQSAEMTPITIVEGGIIGRAAAKLSTMDLQTQEQLLYGRHGGPVYSNSPTKLG